MIRTALLSFWHVHAPIYGRQAQANSALELVAAWDADAERGRAGAAELGIDFVASLDEVLADPTIEAVICQTPTRDHREVIERALRAGKHVFSDKVLAATASDAAYLIDLAGEVGRVLYVGLPNLAHDYTRTFAQLLAAGAIGRLVTMRAVNAHGRAVSGELPPGFFSLEESQGGALIDLCHALYLVPVLAGERPRGVYATMSHLTSRAVEDNAAVTLTFPSGAIGLVEATFASESTPFALEAHGTEGSIRFVAEVDPSGTGAPAGAEVVVRRHDEVAFRSVALAAPGPLPVDDFAAHLVAGTPARANLEVALLLSELNDAAYRSAVQRREIDLAAEPAQ